MSENHPNWETARWTQLISVQLWTSTGDWPWIGWHMQWRETWGSTDGSKAPAPGPRSSQPLFLHAGWWAWGKGGSCAVPALTASVRLKFTRTFSVPRQSCLPAGHECAFRVWGKASWATDWPETHAINKWNSCHRILMSKPCSVCRSIMSGTVYFLILSCKMWPCLSCYACVLSQSKNFPLKMICHLHDNWLWSYCLLCFRFLCKKLFCSNQVVKQLID